MSDWFMVSAWFEKDQKEVHFEISNEDGEQYFFDVSSDVIITHVVKAEGDGLDRFRYSEEDMLALAVSLIDEEFCTIEERFHITQALFNRYFLH
jgi:hypothetical protein